MAVVASGPSRDETRRGLWVVVAGVGLYVVLHVGFRLLASSVLGEDDAVETILAQELHFAYEAFPRQPPLYNWLVYGIEQLVGPGVHGFLILKYSGLLVTAVLLYLAACRVLGDRLFALLSVEAMALIYSISWRFHEGFTHEIGAMVAVAATLLAFLRCIETPSLVRFSVFGTIAGLGLNTEPAYLVFLTCLLCAAFLQPGLRLQLMRPGMLLALAIAAVLIAPFAIWVLSDEARVAALYRESPDHFWYAIVGIKDALRGPFAYLLPLVFILPFMFPGFLRTAWRDLKTLPWRAGEVADGPAAGNGADLALMILHAGLIGMVLNLAGAVVFAIEGLPIHVLMPLYLPLAIWLFSVAQRSDGTPLHTARFTRLAVGIAVVALVARLANMFVLDPVCKTCRWGIPYQGLAQEMTARGFQPDGVIVSLDKETLANLRAVFPHAVAVARLYPDFTPLAASEAAGNGPIAFVWSTRQFGTKRAQRELGDLLPSGVSAKDAEAIEVPWTHLWRETGYRTTTFRLLMVSGADKEHARSRFVTAGR